MSKTQQLTLNLHGQPGDEPLGLALKRACDRCRRRKTRCDGQRSCRSCVRAGVECCYLTAPKPLGRRPRKQQRQQGKGEGECDTGLRRGVGRTSVEERDGGPTYGHDLALGFENLEEGLSSSNAIVPESILHEIPVDSLDQVNMTSHDDAVYPTPFSMDYPPLNLYAPLMNDSLPYDALFGTLTPGSSMPQTQQPYFPPSTVDQASDMFCSPLAGGPVETSSPDWTVPTSAFLPYVKLFFDRLYPVFPVLERDSLPTETSVGDESHRSWDQYALLSSLAAAVTVQLNIIGSHNNEGNPPTTPQSCSSSSPSSSSSSCPSTPFYTAEFWASQAQQARQQWDFMSSDPNEATIMTSFFLFEYYGNRNKSQRAWYYLREAIGFALATGLDDAESYRALEARVAQRRCRLFWLLFITERAYALQHKSSAMLRSSIDLPRIFESDDPKLIYGFVSLVNLFKSVDDKFLSLWKGRPAAAATTCSSSSTTRTKEAGRQTLHAAIALTDQNVDSVCEIVEIQRLDITVTQQWLHLLTWQLQVRRAVSSRSSGLSVVTNRRFPFTVSRDTLQIITMANPKSLECHGIGMEQKIFDIACCLSDMLQCSPNLGREAVSMGHGYLHGFMTMLSCFRNQESEYLQPLLARASTTLAAELHVPAMLMAAPPEEEEEESGLEDMIRRWEEDVPQLLGPVSMK